MQEIRSLSLPTIRRVLPVLLCLSCMAVHGQTAGEPMVYARAADQAVDQAYTAHIREYTTDPSFDSPLTDYLPASSTVPTPFDVL
ncbi:MAG: hypothetical protein WB812_05315, partial [Woeseiaceae bacterium]